MKRTPAQDMTLTKADIVKNLVEKVLFKRRGKGGQLKLFPELDYVPLSRKRATEITNTVFEIIKETLASGEDVRISGFGKFQVKFRWAKKGRNPQTGESIVLRSRRRVTFRPSSKLKEKMNRT